MKKLNRTCVCCSTQYKYCNSCTEDINKPAWMAIYCSDSCRQIFLTSTDFLAGDITKEQAKKQFASCDLSNKTHFHHKIVDTIDLVLKEENVKTTTEKVSNKNSKKNLDSDLYRV